ncbi:hypothetical protein [Campylobacter sp. RM16192]|uniref:hypothetical protein n=1 Tax=Campylobacter sp. RM16192 TaxID=1660080 RepID=UPI00145137E9|nr:hypothetical protein [Campylobacter sp. RM16192]QCD52913.1 hypothetical protein CDOMC_1307 [Campylobacter sp. RM16192]
MRSGFTIVMAIFFMVLVATLGAFALSLSTSTAKHTTDIFLREQAELLAQGAAEMAIEKILFDKNKLSATNCPGVDFLITKFPSDTSDKLFEIKVDVVKIFGDINGCGTAISTDASKGTVILDVTVTANQNITNTPVRFHRRTIQKL